MSGEKDWVRSFQVDLEKRLQVISRIGSTVGVRVGHRLPYALEIHQFEDDGSEKRHVSQYETDLLIVDQIDERQWIPRVVIECKLGSVTTHDALTYSAKAATHKNVHPYLRYGILIGWWEESPLPPRLLRHGAHFDFMATWQGKSPSDGEWEQLMEVLVEEVKASRLLQDMLTNRSAAKKVYSMIHRPLKFKTRY